MEVFFCSSKVVLFKTFFRAYFGNTKLDKKSLVLIDTGGHYLNGTTDITRTLVCGELTPQEKKDFTLVLKGNLSLSNVRIPKGITGVSLDAISRRLGHSDSKITKDVYFHVTKKLIERDNMEFANVRFLG